MERALGRVGKTWEEHERPRPMRACLAQARDELQLMKANLQHTIFEGLGVEAVYRQGSGSDRSTLTGWTVDAVVAKM